MARRTNTAGEGGGDEIMQYFFGGGRGGQQPIDPMASAMQLLGFGQKMQESQSAREEQEAENLIRQATLGQTGAKTQSDIGLAESQMDLNKQLKQASIDEALGRIDFQTKQLANEKLKAQLDMAKTMMADISIPIAERMKTWAALDPDIKNMLDVGAEAANKTKAQELVPNLQAVYAKGAPKEALASLLAPYSQEILQRPEIPWQQLNEELGRQQAGTASGGAGAAGLLWNAPGMAQNVGKGIVNKLLSVAAGKYAPQVPYTEFTNPFEQAAGAPAAQTNLAEMIAPTINAMQPGEYAPGAGFARQQQAPPVDELLKMLVPQQAGMPVR